MSADGLPPLRDVIERHGLMAKKALGQNFLLDLNLTGKVARTAGDLADATVIEVAEVAAHYPGRLEVISGDALQTDFHTLADGEVKIVSNLPYNIGTELLVRWLAARDWPPFWSSLTLMFQREVAQRIVAAPDSEAFGRLGVLAGWRDRLLVVHRCRDRRCSVAAIPRGTAR